MKTTNTTNSTAMDQGYRPVKFVIALLSLMIIFTLPTFAQQRSVGISLNANYSGSGLGSFYIPSVYFQKNRSIISAGPVLNQNNPQSVGVQTCFDYSLKEQNKLNLKNIYAYEEYNSRAELFLFATAMYRPACTLDQSSISLEGKPEDKRSEQIYSKDLEKSKFNTVEAYMGFGLKIRLCDRIKWANRIGAGGYYSPDCPDGLFHTKAAVSLLVRTGFYIDLF